MNQNLTYCVSASARIDAPPRRVYDIIANYRTGHPRILPRQFRNLTVEQGGIGGGTIIRFDVRVLGRTQSFRAIVSEPEPGRVLVEKNVEPAPSTTTFTVSEGPTPSESHITITTEATTAASGILGAVERAVATRVMRRVYAEELSLLAARARETA